MSFSGVAGGFQGGDALLAFAAIQQGRMNEEMTESMRVADLRSQMTGDLAQIKSHLDAADKHPETFPKVAQELKEFMDKYGDEPGLSDVTSVVEDVSNTVNQHVENNRPKQYLTDETLHGSIGGTGFMSSISGTAEHVKQEVSDLLGKKAFQCKEGTVKAWIEQLTGAVDSAGTNDQLAMIHIKQLNDNINNSSSMVSGIIESRNNATSSIINNIA